jgi:hypothetical protein
MSAINPLIILPQALRRARRRWPKSWWRHSPSAAAVLYPPGLILALGRRAGTL